MASTDRAPRCVCIFPMGARHIVEDETRDDPVVLGLAMKMAALEGADPRLVAKAWASVPSGLVRRVRTVMGRLGTLKDPAVTEGMQMDPSLVDHMRAWARDHYWEAAVVKVHHWLESMDERAAADWLDRGRPAIFSELDSATPIPESASRSIIEGSRKLPSGLRMWADQNPHVMELLRDSLGVEYDAESGEMVDLHGPGVGGKSKP